MSSIRRTSPAGEHAARTMSAPRSIVRAFGWCAATAVFVAALAEPASAGLGAVSYENPTKAAERKRREKQAESGQPATAPASPPASAPAPAAGMPAAAPAQGVDRDHAFAAATRRQLAEVVAAAEEQVAHGSDPALAASARRMLETLRKETAELDRWLAAHPQATSAK